MSMISRIRKAIQPVVKPIMFALYGAGGCLLGGLIGEIVLALTPTAPVPLPKPVPPQAVCLLVDCSGSMDGGKLSEAKSAAQAFLDRRDSSGTLVSVVGFGSRTRVASELTDDFGAARAAVAILSDGGGTNMEAGLQVAAQTLAATNLQRNILLFTDGMPDSEAKALQAARQCRQSGVRLIAIGTGDARTGYLRSLTQDRRLVFETLSGDFESAFRQAERAIYASQLIATDAVEEGWRPIMRTAAWSTLIAIGLTLALVVGQNRYLRRRVLNVRQGLMGAGTGLVAGLTAGTVAQTFFGLVARVPLLAGIGRVIAWSLLGCLLGLAMSFYVRNLKRTRASIGGAIGGGLGALAFFLAVSATGDWTGRLVGAAILGFLIGLMVVLAEVLARDAWLVVKWPGGEESTLSLGAKPIVMGSSEEADIYLRRDHGYPPIAATVCITDGKIQFDDRMKNSNHVVESGNKLIVGGLTIEVHAK